MCTSVCVWCFPSPQSTYTHHSPHKFESQFRQRSATRNSQCLHSNIPALDIAHQKPSTLYTHAIQHSSHTPFEYINFNSPCRTTKTLTPHRTPSGSHTVSPISTWCCCALGLYIIRCALHTPPAKSTRETSPYLSRGRKSKMIYDATMMGRFGPRAHHNAPEAWWNVRWLSWFSSRHFRFQVRTRCQTRSGYMNEGIVAVRGRRDWRVLSTFFSRICILSQRPILRF